MRGQGRDGAEPIVRAGKQHGLGKSESFEDDPEMLRPRIGVLELDRSVPARATHEVVLWADGVSGDSRAAQHVQDAAQGDSAAQSDDGVCRGTGKHRLAMREFCRCRQCECPRGIPGRGGKTAEATLSENHGERWDPGHTKVTTLSPLVTCKFSKVETSRKGATETGLLLLIFLSSENQLLIARQPRRCYPTSHCCPTWRTIPTWRCQPRRC